MSTPRLPAHGYIASDGSLFRYTVGNPGYRTVRTLYAMHRRNISTGAQLRASLRAGSSTDLGGYRIAYLTSDGGTLCPDCVRYNLREITGAIRDRDNTGGWRVIGLYHSGESDGDCACDHCSKTVWGNNEPTDEELQEHARHD